MIPHVNVERKEIDRSEGSAAENLEECRESITRLCVGNIVVRHVGGLSKVGNGEMTSTEISKRMRGATGGPREQGRVENQSQAAETSARKIQAIEKEKRLENGKRKEGFRNEFHVARCATDKRTP